MRSIEGLPIAPDSEPITNPEDSKASPEVVALAGQESRLLQTLGARGKSLAGALALMSAISIGKDIAVPEVAYAQGRDGVNVAEEQQNLALFREITRSYKFFDDKDPSAIKEQLALYAQHAELLSSLPPTERAEFMHQEVFTRLSLIKIGYGDWGTLAPEPSTSLKEGSKSEDEWDAIRNDLLVLHTLKEKISEALVLRTGGKPDDFERTRWLGREVWQVRRYLEGLFAETPEAVEAKRDLLHRITKSFAEVSTDFRSINFFSVPTATGERKTSEPSEEDLRYPRVHILLTLNLENSGESVTESLNIYYDPLNHKAVFEEDDFSSLPFWARELVQSLVRLSSSHLSLNREQ